MTYTPETVRDAVPIKDIEGPFDPEMKEAGQLTSPTWELELFLSGAFVFATFQLPGLIESVFSRIEPHTTETGEFVLFTAALYGKAIAFTLIAMFSVHLVMRAYWVALMGLHSVFPKGPKWDALKLGPITREVYRARISDASSVIARLDNACSMIFSIGLLIVFLFLYSTGLVALMGGVAYLLANSVGRLPMRVYFSGLMIAFVAIPVSARLWEKARGSKLDPSSRSYRLLRGLIGASYSMNMMRMMGPMVWTLMTNVGRKKAVAFLYLSLALLITLAMADRLWNGDRLSVNTYDFFGAEGSRSVSYRFYEDKREAGKPYPRVPSIQSDIIKDPYVKLFIPYYPRRHNVALAKLCPGLKPLQRRGMQIGADEDIPDSLASPVLSCMSKLHATKLDGALLPDLQLAFYEQPTTGIKGVVAYIPADSLSRGRHVLEVMPAPPEDLPKDTAALRKAAWKKPYLIPFWR